MKRKKIMNAILFLFIVLCTVFLTSSISNLFIVSNGIEYFADRSHLADYFIATPDDDLSEWFNENEYVIEFSTEEMISITSGDIFIRGTKEYDTLGSILISVVPEMFNLPLNDENEIIKGVNQGEIAISFAQARRNDIELGDELILVIGDENHTFVVSQIVKDIIFGSDLMTATRFFINEYDFSLMNPVESGTQVKAHFYSVMTNELHLLSEDLNVSEHFYLFRMDSDMVRNLYLFEMMTFSILIMIGVFLGVIALILLRFAIVFTLQEDYKEIGMMKAIGLKSNEIKKLYLIKYFFLSMAAAMLGFALSFPLGSMLINDLSQAMALPNILENLMIPLLSTASIIFLVVIFCYMCTRKVDKLVAIEAIKNGKTGERNHKRGLPKLDKRDRLPVVLYLAINDILSHTKSYLIVLVVFTLNYLLIIILPTAVNTIMSDQGLELMGVAPADVFFETERFGTFFRFEGSAEELKQELLALELFYQENGIDIRLQAELFNSGATIYVNPDKVITTNIQQGLLISGAAYTYLRGEAPMLANEVAVAELTLEAIGADVGDEVYIQFRGETHRYLVTASLQIMNDFGHGVRLSENSTMWDGEDASFLIFAVGGRFVDRSNISGQIDELINLSENYDILETRDILRDLIGGIVDIISNISLVISIIILIATLLITILMSISFFIKDVSQIALLKNLGFKVRIIRLWQGFRIALVMVLALAIGILLVPFSNLGVGLFFRMMGAPQISVDPDVIMVYIVYPFLLLALICSVLFLITKYVKKISLHQMGNPD